MIELVPHKKKLGALERPPDNRLEKHPVTRARHSQSDAEIQLELRNEIEVQGRHDEMLLLLHLFQRLNRPHVAIVLKCRRNPAAQIIE